MSLVRMLVTTKVTLSHTFVADESPTDAGGAVTVTVKRLDGTVVDSGTADAGTLGDGVYSWPVTRAVLDTLTVDWTGSVGGSTVTVRDYVEVVGDFYFGLAEARDELNLSKEAWPSVKLARKRIQVENECERICERAFVPRFARERLTGSGTSWLATKWPELRVLRAVSVAGVAWSPGDVAAVGLSPWGVLTRPGGAVWPAGAAVVVEHEHGLDMPSEELRDASMERLQSILGRKRSGIPARASSFTDPTGAVYRLTLPTDKTTGIPDVDGVYAKYIRKRRAVVA